MIGGRRALADKKPIPAAIAFQSQFRDLGDMVRASCLHRGIIKAEIGRTANKARTGGDVPMMHKFLPRAAFALAACVSSALLGGSTAQASFSAEYVFGDSLSDNGNLASVEGPFPDPPSFDNSFTNGPVAVQLLAQSLGLSANASLWLTGTSPPAGTNYAVGGATAVGLAAGGFPGINLPQQVAAYSSVSGHADPNALYVLMIGGNDVIAAVASNSGASAVKDGADQEVAEISTLAGEGATHFLVVNVPDVGQIPLFAPNPGLAAEATTFSIDYDQKLAGDLAHPTTPLPAGTMIQQFNLFSFNAGILANAARLGFTNTTDPCYTFMLLPTSAETTPECGPNAENINTFLYFNDVHPTAPVQALWAQGLRSVVPEPSTWAMLLIGFVGLGFAGYRRGARARAAA
jgi:phospholipase/lecithinase/hemolysin